MFVSVKGDQRGFPGNQCLGLWASTAEGLDLIPGQGTKFPASCVVQNEPPPPNSDHRKMLRNLVVPKSGQVPG